MSSFQNHNEICIHIWVQFLLRIWVIYNPELQYSYKQSLYYEKENIDRNLSIVGYYTITILVIYY